MPETITGNNNVGFQLRMTPPCDLLDVSHRFVERFCSYIAELSPGRDQRFALAIHEITQNAVSYSCGDTVELTLELDRSTGHVELRTRNNAKLEHIKRATTRIVEMREAEDPLQYYLALMRQTDLKGGLGLARIWYEGMLTLTYHQEGEQLVVVAVGEASQPIEEPPPIELIKKRGGGKPMTGSLDLDLHNDYFTLKLEQDTAWTLRFSGTILVLAATYVLRDLLSKVHEHLMAASARQLVVDLTELKFLSSSGFRELVVWIEKLDALPEQERYGLCFRTNPRRGWQKTGLHALSCFAPKLLQIEE